jgi:hypothetical protein
LFHPEAKELGINVNLMVNEPVGDHCRSYAVDLVGSSGSYFS